MQFIADQNSSTRTLFQELQNHRAEQFRCFRPGQREDQPRAKSRSGAIYRGLESPGVAVAIINFIRESRSPGIAGSKRDHI